MAETSRKLEIEKSDGAKRARLEDRVAVEEPLEIQVVAGGATGAAAKSVSVTMRTPGNDGELATGFLFTEGILASPDQVASIEAVGPPAADGGQNTIRVGFAARFDPDLGRLERHFYTTSSCGVCGKATLEALTVAGCASLSDERTTFPSAILLALPARVRKEQDVFRATGGLHAAAIFGPDGNIDVVREDVGRHNATDKVIGAMFAAGALPGQGKGLFVSGRASFELVQKALVAGIPLIAAVGAPSSLAVDTAREFGMTLVGFLRDGGFNVYTGSERIG